jgi:exodeoxyribonuclease VII large subunit
VLERLSAQLGQLSPLKILERGYAIVSNEQGIVKDAAAASPGSDIHVRFGKGERDARVTR